MKCWAMVTLSMVLAVHASAANAPISSSADGVLVPTVYEAGHFYAVPQTRDGRRLRLLVDTGGGGAAGMYWVSAAAAKHLSMTPAECRIDDETLSIAALPDYKAGRGLPLLEEGPCGRSLMVNPGDIGTYDGQLGGTYLSKGIWTFDYPAERLTSETSIWKANPTDHKAGLGFQRGDDGRPTTGFARIEIRVDAEVLDMLLDTGASSFPTPDAARISGTPTVHGVGVTSYITSSTLERWHKAHPAWRVVQDADYKVAAKPLKRIIEVPKVEIAGWRVGPVWFTEQPDIAFHKYMAQWMDKPTEGAVGGNVFSHFRMTIDYPQSAAYFRCIRGCTAVLTSRSRK